MVPPYSDLTSYLHLDCAVLALAELQAMLSTVYIRATAKALWRRFAIVSFWMSVFLLTEALLPYEIPTVSVLLHSKPRVALAEFMENSTHIALPVDEATALVEDETLEAQVQILNLVNATGTAEDLALDTLDLEEMEKVSLGTSAEEAVLVDIIAVQEQGIGGEVAEELQQNGVELSMEQIV